MKTYTPNMNDGKTIFVFGSNLAGIHGGGAAFEAQKHWGASPGIGCGRKNYSYGIPTKDSNIETLPLDFIKIEVDLFIEYAHTYPELRFLVTAIGCGLAGYTEADIKPMFTNAPANCELPEGWRKA